MGMESRMRFEDQGPESNKAHEEANKLKVLVEGTGEQESITAGDYDEALGALSQIENAPKNIEAQRSILEKLGRGALGAIALVTGRVPEHQLERDSKGYPIQPTVGEKFHYFADGSELKEAKRKILDLQRKADFVSKGK